MRIGVPEQCMDPIHERIFCQLGPCRHRRHPLVPVDMPVIRQGHGRSSSGGGMPRRCTLVVVAENLVVAIVPLIIVVTRGRHCIDACVLGAAWPASRPASPTRRDCQKKHQNHASRGAKDKHYRVARALFPRTGERRLLRVSGQVKCIDGAGK